jgi:hypothetical protein
MAAWRELSLAQLINTNINIAPAASSSLVVGEGNAPASSSIKGGFYTLIAGGAWTVRCGVAAGRNGYFWNAPSSVTTNINMLMLGGINGWGANMPTAAALTGSDAYSLDQKMDDGNGATGNFRAVDSWTVGATGNCVSSTGAYNLTNPGGNESFNALSSSYSCLVGIALD